MYQKYASVLRNTRPQKGQVHETQENQDHNKYVTHREWNHQALENHGIACRQVPFTPSQSSEMVTFFFLMHQFVIVIDKITKLKVAMSMHHAPCA
jgi:hypothetical protein